MLDTPADKEILPKGPEDEIIPSKISVIDDQIASHHTEIARLTSLIADLTCDRNLLLARAKEVNVIEDVYCKIVYIPIYPKKKVDVAAFKRLAPDKFEMACKNVLAKIEDDFKASKENVEISFTHADVKAVVKDKAILAQVIPEPTTPTGYDVSIVKKV